MVECEYQHEFIHYIFYACFLSMKVEKNRYLQLNSVIMTLLCVTPRLQRYTLCGTKQFSIRRVFFCRAQYDINKRIYLIYSDSANYLFPYNFPRSRLFLEFNHFLILEKPSLPTFSQLCKFQVWKMTVIMVILFVCIKLLCTFVLLH